MNSNIKQDKSIYIKALLPIIIISFVSRIGANIYLPALPDIAGTLSLSNSEATETITIYFLVLSISCLIAGAISDFYNKRKLLLIGSMAIIIGSILCAMAMDKYMLLAGRGIQAFGGAVILVTSQTWLGQMSTQKSMVEIFAYFSLSLSIAPLFAPTLGGIITDILSWRYNFYLLIVITILAALSIRNSKNKEQYPTRNKEDLSILKILKEYGQMIISPRFIPIIGTSLMCYFFQGGFMAYSSFLFIEEMGLNPSSFGLLSAPIVAGLILGRFPTIFIERKYGIMATYKFNSLVVGISMALSLLYYFIVGTHTVWELLAILTIFNVGFSGHVILSLRNAMILFDKQRGQVSATVNFLNQTVSYIASFLVQILFARHISSMTNYNIFAAISIVLVVVLYIAFRYNYKLLGNKI